MGKYKENAKYNVVCMRVSEEEKLALEELMREAIQLYTPQLETRIQK